jgi:hypothetical protein
MRKFLNPKVIRELVRQLRTVRRHGGPKRIEVESVGEPRGILAPFSEVEMNVESKDGTVTPVTAPIPIAWPYAWGYRIAKKLKLPIVRSFDPTRIHFALRIPRRG